MSTEEVSPPNRVLNKVPALLQFLAGILIGAASLYAVHYYDSKTEPTIRYHMSKGNEQYTPNEYVAEDGIEYYLVPVINLNTQVVTLEFEKTDQFIPIQCREIPHDSKDDEDGVGLDCVVIVDGHADIKSFGR